MTSSTGHMVRFRPRDWLDHVFEIGIVLSPTLGLIALTGF